jgi:hypothetical protein
MAVDSPPDGIENFYDELEDPADAGRILTTIHPNEAGWLARHIRNQLERERENAGEEIESELKARSFRHPLSEVTECGFRVYPPLEIFVALGY